MGQNLVTYKKLTNDSAEAGREYADIWKNVGQSMLDSLGPALTQAGLSLLIKDPEMWAAALSLIAAGGVLSFSAGLFDTSKKDERAEQENRLKNLKDLLLEVLNQARADAEYYQKEMLHQDALSQINSIQSVNDAIIAPGGKVITTAPDDYLIATKTPGSLSSSGTVTINFIDQSSGARVQVKSQEQRRKSDGSVEITAVVAAIMDERIANGEADNAFAAREVRLNGRHFAY